jgi:uncharacterized membrane protein
LKAHQRAALLLAMAAAVCLGVNRVSSIASLEALSAVPLVLLLPGASLVLAVDPWHGHMVGAERLMWSVLGSIVSAIAGGLILNVASELSQTTWLAYLFGVVIVGAVASALRRGDEAMAGGRESTRPFKIRVRPTAALWTVGALVLASAALAISVYSSATSDQEHFVQLWILPIPGGAGSTATHAEVGLTNYEGRKDRFDVVIQGTGTGVHVRRELVLAEGQTWTYHFIRKTLAPVIATVALTDNPNHALSSVRLASPAK